MFVVDHGRCEPAYRVTFVPSPRTSPGSRERRDKRMAERKQAGCGE